MNNQSDFQQQLDSLSQLDRQEIETFIGYLKSRSQKPLTLVDKVNDQLLESYEPLAIDYMEVDDDGNYLLKIFFLSKERCITFDLNWFKLDYPSGNPKIFELADNDGYLFVKYRSDSNRIEKIAIDEKYLTEVGLRECKKRILPLKQLKNVEVPISVINSTEALLARSEHIHSDLAVNVNLSKPSGVLNTPGTENLIIASVSKNHDMFKDLDDLLDGKPRLDRVANIMVNFINSTTEKSFTWDSEFFYDQRYDFTDIETGNKIKVKAHFRSGDCLELSEFSLKNIDADIILSVLIEEFEFVYKITICGFISKEDFMSRTKPWNYNNKVVLRMMELSDLNDAKVLFE